MIQFYDGKDFLDVRNKTIIMLLFDTGMRCNEMILIKNRSDITRAYGCRRYDEQKATDSRQAEVVCARIERESAGAAPRGVVKNLEGDADLAEGERCSISPDRVEIYRRKASVFHRNVIGRGLFALRK